MYSLILHGIRWIGFDIRTLRVGIGIFIGMTRRGLGSFSEKMKGYGIGSVFYACPIPNYSICLPCFVNIFVYP